MTAIVSSIKTPFLISLLLLVSCGNNQFTETSNKVLVSDVPHTSVKNQSTDNCWAFAIAGWAESLHLRATGKKVNISESYWTYWQMYEKLVGSNASVKVIDLGSNWLQAKKFIASRGLMLDRDFSIANQYDLHLSAEKSINIALKKGGALHDPSSRTPENVIKALDRAFHVRIADKALKVIRAKDFIVGKHSDSRQPTTLLEAISDTQRMWKVFEYPYVENSARPTNDDIVARRKLLRRVMRALNDGYPVIMGVMLEFKAWNKTTNTFEGKKLLGKPKAATQGGHLIVLEDYAVTNVPDGRGGTIDIGPGPATPELKRLAVNGTVTEFIAKNSWGVADMAPGIKPGYFRFDMAYLDATWTWFNEEKVGLRYTTLGDFTLPPSDD